MVKTFSRLGLEDSRNLNKENGQNHVKRASLPHAATPKKLVKNLTVAVKKHILYTIHKLKFSRKILNCFMYFSDKLEIWCGSGGSGGV